MNKIETGEPAFPTQEQRFPDGVLNREAEYGMTLRDYFAAKALNGLLAMEANPAFGTACEPYSSHGRSDLMAKDAYTLADAMLEARK